MVVLMEHAGRGFSRAPQIGCLLRIDLQAWQQFGQDTLRVSTVALKSGNGGDDSTYTRLENQLLSLGSQRDALAAQMSAMLDHAEFTGQDIDQGQALALIAQGSVLLAQVHALAKTVA